MKFVARVVKKSSVDRLWKSKNRKDGEFGGNKFSLSNDVYTCDNIQNLSPLVMNKNFLVEAFGMDLTRPELRA